MNVLLGIGGGVLVAAVLVGAGLAGVLLSIRLDERVAERKIGES